MATSEEIERRIAEADSARSAQRSATARRVGELAQRRAAIAEQLRDIERELGDVLAAAGDVIDIEELARFTDVPAADLTRWLSVRKPTRSNSKRKRSAGSGTNDVSTENDMRKQSSVVRAPTDALESRVVPRVGAEVPVRVAARGA